MSPTSKEKDKCADENRLGHLYMPSAPSQSLGVWSPRASPPPRQRQRCDDVACDDVEVAMCDMSQHGITANSIMAQMSANLSNGQAPGPGSQPQTTRSPTSSSPRGASLQQDTKHVEPAMQGSSSSPSSSSSWRLPSSHASATSAEGQGSSPVSAREQQQQQQQANALEYPLSDHETAQSLGYCADSHSAQTGSVPPPVVPERHHHNNSPFRPPYPLSLEIPPAQPSQLGAGAEPIRAGAGAGALQSASVSCYPTPLPPPSRNVTSDHAPSPKHDPQQQQQQHAHGPALVHVRQHTSQPSPRVLTQHAHIASHDQASARRDDSSGLKHPAHAHAHTHAYAHAHASPSNPSRPLSHDMWQHSKPLSSGSLEQCDTYKHVQAQAQAQAQVVPEMQSPRRLLNQHDGHGHGHGPGHCHPNNAFQNDSYQRQQHEHVSRAMPGGGAGGAGGAGHAALSPRVMVTVVPDALVCDAAKECPSPCPSPTPSSCPPPSPSPSSGARSKQVSVSTAEPEPQEEVQGSSAPWHQQQPNHDGNGIQKMTTSPTAQDAGDYAITATICYADEVGARVLSPRHIGTPERKIMSVPRLMAHMCSPEAVGGGGEARKLTSSPSPMWRRDHDHEEAAAHREERQRCHIGKLQEALMAANQSLLETNQKLQVCAGFPILISSVLKLAPTQAH
jgi:hypothetical protein